MRACRFLVPALLLVAFTSLVLHARAGTASESGRKAEGDCVKKDGKQVVIKRSSNKSSKLPITKPRTTCQIFSTEPDSVRSSAATASPDRTGDASKPFRKLNPPVILKVSAIKGKGKLRKADIVVNNTSGRTIEKMLVDMYFLKKDGTVGKSVPHTNNFAFEDGESKTINVTSTFMEEDTASIGGVVSGLKFADGREWPAVPAKMPAKKGKEPVAAEMIGLVGSGNMIKPAVACYNHSAKGVKGVNYLIEYLDADGKVLETTGYGYSAGDSFMKPGKGKVIRGGKGPPKGASRVRVRMGTVSFADGSKWKP